MQVCVHSYTIIVSAGLCAFIHNHSQWRFVCIHSRVYIYIYTHTRIIMCAWNKHVVTSGCSPKDVHLYLCVCVWQQLAWFWASPYICIYVCVYIYIYIIYHMHTCINHLMSSGSTLSAGAFPRPVSVATTTVSSVQRNQRSRLRPPRHVSHLLMCMWNCVYVCTCDTSAPC